MAVPQVKSFPKSDAVNEAGGCVNDQLIIRKFWMNRQ
jgi:hypothetical protein